MDNRNKTADIVFSLTGSLIIILFFSFINFTTKSKFPWFIFPAFGVLWWPISIIFGKHTGKLFSLVGSTLIIALLFIVNYLTSWNFPWFIFPSFAILWWPLTIFLWNKSHKLFSLIGSISIIVFAVISNSITTPSVLWFHYIVFAVIWWPINIFFPTTKVLKINSIAGAILLTAFISFESFIRYPFSYWALLTYFPILMWPVSIYMGEKLKKTYKAIFFTFIGITYYSLINLYIYKGFPWAVYPAYALLWWPISVSAPKKNKAMFFATAGSILTVSMFIFTNIVTTPNEIWAVYPIFGLLWWPLSVYYYVFKNKKITE